MSWGYSEADGPLHWVLYYEAAAGPHQSPIDIKTATTEYDPQLGYHPLRIEHTRQYDLEVENNGHSFQADVDESSTISGGPLGDAKYHLKQFHFHWGSSDLKGSEHKVDGKQYSAELHFVHWNATKYSTFDDAADKEDGLAVLGVFIKVGQANEEFKKLTDVMHEVHNPHTTTHVKTMFDSRYLLPGNVDKYWTYPGSLTTPPCYESVTWILLEEAICLSHTQLMHLRHLIGGYHGDSHGGYHEDNILNNVRTINPLGDRVVKASFPTKT
ncbi:carbonic anhydrase 1-like [Haliotis cracherodii]|uniref:carbonic anhydrase 1-like n=1 Tax=Haliotis cracherodii TaxID=6455 RepID=UPI0039EB6B59